MFTFSFIAKSRCGTLKRATNGSLHIIAFTRADPQCTFSTFQLRSFGIIRNVRISDENVRFTRRDTKLNCAAIFSHLPFKDEVQAALFKGPVLTVQ